MAQNDSSGISLDDAVIIIELCYHNQELSFLLFGSRQKNTGIQLPTDEQKNSGNPLPEFERRKKVDEVLNNPEKYLDSLRLTLITISCIIIDIVDFAKRNSIPMKLQSAKDVPYEDIDYYNYHPFTIEAINSISYLNLEDASLTSLTVQHSYDCYTKIKEALLVTIARFEKYIEQYDTPQSRSKLIEQYYIDNSYN